jgi:hypothetical protein
MKALALVLLSLAGCNSDVFTDDAGPMDQPDLAMAGPTHDLAMTGPPRDLAGVVVPPDMTQVMPPMGSVGVNGGTVNRLFFGVTGDTRPMNCDDAPNYPTQVITKIFTDMNTAGVQFAVATGDHQYVCNGGYTEGVKELTLYAKAAKSLTNKIVFPVMGNHECNETSFCPPGTNLGRFKAYEDTILSPNWKLPYYTFDVKTDAGLARFIMVADTAWDANESAWLSTTLTNAEAQAKYIFVFRHYPLDTFFGDNNVDPELMAEESIIKAHHYSLLITGHTHQYKHDYTGDPSGRAIIMGLGGAPLTGNAAYYGYLTVAQQANGSLTVTVFDDGNGNMTDAFTVQP